MGQVELYIGLVNRSTKKSINPVESFLVIILITGKVMEICDKYLTYGKTTQPASSKTEFYSFERSLGQISHSHSIGTGRRRVPLQ